MEATKQTQHISFVEVSYVQRRDALLKQTEEKQQAIYKSLLKSRQNCLMIQNRLAYQSSVSVSTSAQGCSISELFYERGKMKVAYGLTLLLLSASCFLDAASAQVHMTDVRTITGAGNHPDDSGSAGSVLIRISEADFPNEIGEEIREGANPRLVSNLVVSQKQRFLPSRRGMSDAVWAWGQFIDHDLDLTDSNPDNGAADIAVLDPVICYIQPSFSTAPITSLLTVAANRSMKSLRSWMVRRSTAQTIFERVAAQNALRSA